LPRLGYTAEDVIAALRAFHAAHGRWPTRGEWERQRGVPSYSFVAKRWGWRNALVMAGGESRRVTHCRRGHPLTDGNVLIRWGGDRRCLTCARAEWRHAAARRRLRVLVARELRDPRARDRLPTYAAELMPSTLTRLNRLSATELAEVRRAAEDELVQTARHTAQVVALIEQVKRRQEQLADRGATPTVKRRLDLAASGSPWRGA
jgi:Homing endonuclease associated repeat